MAFTLRSSAFQDGATIPSQFTCDANNLAPPLAWSDAPEGTRSFALVMDDPDAPHGTFTHWLLYDISPKTTELGDQPFGTALPNGFGRAAYGGPCPPPGPWVASICLYALRPRRVRRRHTRQDSGSARALTTRAHVSHRASDGPL